jgi:hypothetical protein
MAKTDAVLAEIVEADTLSTIITDLAEATPPEDRTWRDLLPRAVELYGDSSLLAVKRAHHTFGGRPEEIDRFLAEYEAERTALREATQALRAEILARLTPPTANPTR